MILRDRWWNELTSKTKYNHHVEEATRIGNELATTPICTPPKELNLVYEYEGLGGVGDYYHLNVDDQEMDQAIVDENIGVGDEEDDDVAHSDDVACEHHPDSQQPGHPAHKLELKFYSEAPVRS